MGREKNFCGGCWHQTCVLSLLHDHTYAQKQTESVLDASMWWYDSKRELMAIFWISYPLKGVYKGNFIEIEQKLCFGDLLLYLCGPWKFFYALLAPNMCIHKLPYDHGFAQKQSKSVFDASIKFYYHKRDAMVTFCRWYFLRRILHSFTIKVTLRSSKIVFCWSSIVSLWAVRKLF